MKRFNILIPVYNDWKSLYCLVENIDSIIKSAAEYEISILLVNDSSTEEKEAEKLGGLLSERIKRITIVNLSFNLGHQKALAVGLGYLSRPDNPDTPGLFTIIMDGDGEDDPDDVPRLIDAHLSASGREIIVAERGKRSENLLFRLFYYAYLWLFYILTGQKLNFGNFCLIPAEMLGRMAMNPAIRISLAAGLLRSGLSISGIRCDRGRRLCGKSRMSLFALISHGIAAISIFTDAVIIKTMAFSFTSIVLSLLYIVYVLYSKYVSMQAISGWTTLAAGLVILVMFQNLIILILSIFIHMNFQNIRGELPSGNWNNYIRDVEEYR